MGVNTQSNHIDNESEPATAFDSLVDWAVGGLLTVVGLVVALGGLALYYAVGRAGIEDLVRNGDFRSDVLTEAEAIDGLVALADWGGVGLVAAGGLSVLVGVALVIAHRRARRAGRGTPRWILGVVGAGVGLILSFIPLSPVLGGAAAGYLDPSTDSSGVGAGALAGVFAALPVVIVSVFASVGLFLGLPGEAAAMVAIFIGIAVLFSLVYVVGLSALGGYVGGRLRDS